MRKLPPDQRRSHLVCCRLSTDELAALVAAQRASGTATMGRYVRDLIMTHGIVPTPLGKP